MSKRKDDDGETLVLNYLTAQNRPFSMSDIAQNLHKEVGKTGVQKLLDKLVKDEKVTEKTYGKQKIYFVNQSSLSDANPDLIKSLDFQIEGVEKIKKDVGREKTEILSELRKTTDSLTTTDLQKAVDTLRSEIDQRKEKLKSLQETTVIVDKGQRDASRAYLNRCIKEWRCRKNKCMEVVGGLLENCTSPIKEMFEEIGIITDEEAGVKIPILK